MAKQGQNIYCNDTHNDLNRIYYPSVSYTYGFWHLVGKKLYKNILILVQKCKFWKIGENSNVT